MKRAALSGWLRGLGFAAVAAMLPALASAQERATVTGQVTDAATGAPIAEVRVNIQGTTLQSISDLRGNFRITGVMPGEVTIQARRIGYRQVELTVTLSPGQEYNANIRMGTSLVVLEEVVISGTAGELKRRAQAATVAEIGVSDLAQVAPVQSLSSVLQSRVPGVSVIQTSGTAGTSSQIRIRGASSISLSNEPLYVIDGVVMARGTLLATQSGQRADRINDLDPNDIESIEVVKGPAAATLYGADASTGVISIITKRGRVNSGRFTQQISFEYNSIDPNFTPPSNFAFCTAAAINPVNQNPLCIGQTTTTLVSDNPLVREGAFRNGSMYGLGWTGRGGGQNYGYYASINYDTEDGTVPNTGFDRQSARVNFNWVPSERLTLDVGFNVLRSISDLPDNDNNVYGYLGGGLLGTPLTRREDGAGANGWFGFERDVAAISAIENRVMTHRTIASATANWNPVNWLTNRFTVGGDLFRDEETRFFPKNSRGSYQGVSNTGDITETRRGGERLTLDYLGNIRQQYMSDKLVMNFSFGAQLLDARTEFVSATGQGLTVNSNNMVSAASSRSGSQSWVRQRQVGILGQLQFGWQDQLYLTLGARYDANSSFGAEADWFFLPKVGLSWVASETDFWQNNLSFINTMRLRGAWGQTGRSPTPGASLTTLSSSPFIIGTTVSSGAVPLNPGNQNLKAERGIELELGFDAGFANDRVGLEFTYYDKTTRDLLLARPLPPSLGFSANPFVNIGEVVNKGVEVAFTAVPVQKPNFSWDFRVGANTLDNKVTDMGEVAAFGTTNRIEEGYQVGAWRSFKIRSVDEANNRVTVSNDGEIIGNVLPTLEANISTNVTFLKNFRLYASVDTKQDYLVQNWTDYFRETQLVRSDNRLDVNKLSNTERLRRYGDQTPGRPAFIRENGASATVNDVYEAYLQPGDYWRFREVSLTATIPSSWAQKFGAQAGAITLGGQNLALWSDYEGFDPEVVSAADAAFNRQDFLTVPPSRKFIVRVNLTF